MGELSIEYVSSALSIVLVLARCLRLVKGFIIVSALVNGAQKVKTKSLCHVLIVSLEFTSLLSASGFSNSDYRQSGNLKQNLPLSGLFSMVSEYQSHRSCPISPNMIRKQYARDLETSFRHDSALYESCIVRGLLESKTSVHTSQYVHRRSLPCTL